MDDEESQAGGEDTLAIPCYDRDSYSRLLEVATDRDLLPPTFDSWVHEMERVSRTALSRGIRPVRVPIDPSLLLRWCAENGLDPDSLGRLAYAEKLLDDLQDAESAWRRTGAEPGHTEV